MSRPVSLDVMTLFPTAAEATSVFDRAEVTSTDGATSLDHSGDLAAAGNRSRAVIAVAVQALAAMAILVSWLQVSATRDTDRQMPRVAGSVVAFAVAAGANAQFVLSMRRAVAVRLATRFSAVKGAARPPAVADTVLVSGAGMTFYHRADCPFVAGKAVQAEPLDQHQRRGRTPCGVCQP